MALDLRRSECDPVSCFYTDNEFGDQKPFGHMRRDGALLAVGVVVQTQICSVEAGSKLAGAVDMDAPLADTRL